MKWVPSVLASLVVLAALQAPAASAAPGELDPTFGASGSERIFLAKKGTLSLRGVAVQPDGKIVLAGRNETAEAVLVVRLLENGAFDPSFGNGGVVTTPLPAESFGEGRAVAIQPDGKIVVVGVAKGLVNADFAAFRYLANGAPDPAFGGGDGIELIPVGALEDRAEAVTIGANERILLTGEARLPAGKSKAGVVILQADGKPDPGFGAGGVKLLSLSGMAEVDRGEGIAQQPDGKIVIADGTGAATGGGFTIARLLAGGELDPGFGMGGVVNTPIPGSATAKGRATDVLVQPDGRIVASGFGYDEVGPKAEADSKFAAVRYSSDGKLDPSFGGGTGIFSHQIGGGDDTAQRIALTANGRIVLAGPYTLPPSDDSLAVMRLDPSGVLDPGFGAGGIARRGPTALFGNVFEDAALDSRERVVVVSTDFVADNNTEFEVSRFLGDLPPDSTPADSTAPSSSPGQAKTQPPAPLNRAPHARMKAIPRKLETTKLTGFSGTAADPENGGIAKVQIAVVRASTAKAGRAATCQELANARGRFKTVKAVRGTCPLRWLTATGKAKWSFRLKTVLPPGRYVAYSRAVDSAGLAEESFSRAAGNRFGFRLLAPEPAPRPR